MPGAGIGICHDFMTARTDLVRLFPELSVTRSYWTVWHENLRVARRVQAFADLLDPNRQRRSRSLSRGPVTLRRLSP